VAIEGGLFGQFTKMDAELAMDDVLAIGARLGVYVLFRNFAIEFDGQYGKTDWASPNGNVSIDFMPVALRGVYGIPLGERLRFLLGGDSRRIFTRTGYRRSRAAPSPVTNTRTPSRGSSA
jgi:hypothetical protein